MKQSELAEAIRFGDQYLHNVAVDNVILGYHDKELKVLLQRPRVVDKWTVAGGYIKKTESIEAAASRIAFDRTGLKNLYFQQYRAFGNPQRSLDKTFTPKHLNKTLGTTMPNDLWIFDYFVAIGFYTLTEFSKVEPQKSELDADCRWWPINGLPPMLFDHELQISEALRTLRMHIAHYPIGYELLPEKFTLPEIHALYETVLGRSLDDRNFTRRLTATGIIVKLKETKRIGPHRSPFLYKFDKKKYELGLKEGYLLVF